MSGIYTLPDPNRAIGKYGFLSLRALKRNGRTEIDPVIRRTPYQWQGYHYQDHDDQPFLLLHSSSGGFVEGDTAELHFEAEPDTRTLLSTTAATKFYKCETGLEAEDFVEISLGERATLEYLPDEIIPFARSKSVRRTQFLIEPSSRLFASELIAAGRINYKNGERFAFSSLYSELSLSIGGKLLFLDRLLAENQEEVAALEYLWAGRNYIATIIAYAPDLPSGIEESVEKRAAEVEGVYFGSSRRDQLFSARLVANKAWQAHEAIFAVWEILRPAIAGKVVRTIMK